MITVQRECFEFTYSFHISLKTNSPAPADTLIPELGWASSHFVEGKIHIIVTASK